MRCQEYLHLKKVLLLAVLIPFFLPAQSDWQKRKEDFHQRLKDNRQYQQKKLQEKHHFLLYFQGQKTARAKLKNHWLKQNDLKYSNTEAQRLFSSFLQKKQPHPLKQSFLNNHRRQKAIQQKYFIPLEKQLFFPPQ